MSDGWEKPHECALAPWNGVGVSGDDLRDRRLEDARPEASRSERGKPVGNGARVGAGRAPRTTHRDRDAALVRLFEKGGRAVPPDAPRPHRYSPLSRPLRFPSPLPGTLSRRDLLRVAGNGPAPGRFAAAPHGELGPG